MDAQRILVATDLSVRCGAPLELATTLALDSGASLLIVHVEEPPIIFRGDEISYGLDRLHQGLSADVHADLVRELEKVTPADPRVQYEHHLLVGEPVDTIVKFAAEQNADMIVIGTHGWIGWRRMLLGSVAEAIVRRAPCPVMTVKSSEPAAAMN